MREIKFRGKSTEGKWVYGSFFDSGEYAVIYDPSDKTYYQCYLESIGQYTGLKDKNGCEIYEGDIFHYGDKKILYMVEWHDTGLMGKACRATDCIGLSYWRDRIEIIGRIYEHPELLEAAK